MSSLIKRHLEPRAHAMLEHFPGLIIEGARQVGKSTLAAAIAAPDAVIVTLDDQQVRDAAAADPAGFVAQAGPKQLVVDEIQRLPELTLAIKAEIDRNRTPGRFILTGSSSLLRVLGTVDSLAGRVARFDLYGLSQGEIARRSDDFATAVRTDLDGMVGARSAVDRAGYAALLERGSYPEVWDAPAPVRSVWIDSYLKGVIGRDLSDLRPGVQPSRAFSVLRALSGRQSAELVKSKLAQDTAIPPTSITGYIDLLHDLGLVTIVPPWTPNLAKREIGRPKAFVTDSSLAMRLSRLTSAQLARFEYGESLGAMLEAFVGAELLRQRTWSEHDFDVFHYRDRAGDEVDFVLEFADGAVVGIEVKAAQSFNAGQFKGLARMRDRLGDRFVGGVVLNTGDAGYRYADRLYGAPVSALWQQETKRAPAVEAIWQGDTENIALDTPPREIETERDPDI